MDREWNHSQPILPPDPRPCRRLILDGVLKEGDPPPSVRNVAAEYRVHPLTVLKGYQQLVDEQLVDSKRGVGMFIHAGARNLLLRDERQKFLAEQWPRVCATIQPALHRKNWTLPQPAGRDRTLQGRSAKP